MQREINTANPRAVAREVQAIHLALFSEANPAWVPRVFSWALDCFAGRYADFQSIDAQYHDLEHTMQGTLCMARLLQGRAQAGASPTLTREYFEWGILAILLHDTGYLKEAADTEGTGAKYTWVHVDRSAAFAAQLLTEKGYSSRAVQAVQNMIHCTGIYMDIDAIPFANELERTMGFALGTADYLGQMAAPDYVDKLPILYEEFAESAQYQAHREPKPVVFRNAKELMRNTPEFWSEFVLPKLERDFRGLYHYLRQPYPDGPNWYLQKIQANIELVRRRVAEQPLAP